MGSPTIWPPCSAVASRFRHFARSVVTAMRSTRRRSATARHSRWSAPWEASRARMSCLARGRPAAMATTTRRIARGRRCTRTARTTPFRGTSGAWTLALSAPRASWCLPVTPRSFSSWSRRPRAISTGSTSSPWVDLERVRRPGVRLTELDVERAEALARFLAEAHAEKRDDPALYARRLRELVGHGECVMGILDSYPHPYPPLPAEVCESLEHDFVSWRWRLRPRACRLSRVHGDFHPWNILFRRGTDFSVLDRSRGEWGEPADDVAALAVNYLFFGMRREDELGDVGIAEPFRVLFARFLQTYVMTSGDYEIFETLPPFFAFRALVLAHPYWYPTLSEGVRGQLLHFARSMAVSSRFDPTDVSWLCGVAR